MRTGRQLSCRSKSTAVSRNTRQWVGSRDASSDLTPDRQSVNEDVVWATLHGFVEALPVAGCISLPNASRTAFTDTGQGGAAWVQMVLEEQRFVRRREMPPSCANAILANTPRSLAGSHCSYSGAHQTTAAGRADTATCWRRAKLSSFSSVLPLLHPDFCSVTTREVRSVVDCTDFSISVHQVELRAARAVETLQHRGRFDSPAAVTAAEIKVAAPSRRSAASSSSGTGVKTFTAALGSN